MHNLEDGLECSIYFVFQKSSFVPQPPKRTGILEKIAACCVASSLSHPDIMFFQVPYECNNHQTQYPSL